MNEYIMYIKDILYTKYRIIKMNCNKNNSCFLCHKCLYPFFLKK